MTTTTAQQPPIGTVFVTSWGVFMTLWGYDQTNVDAYQVVSHHGKTTVGLRKVAVVPAGGRPYDGWAGDVKPVRDDFVSDEVFKKRVRNGVVKTKFGYASPWDGERLYYKSSYAWHNPSTIGGVQLG